MVRHISDRVGVMYLGKIVELADSQELYSHPMHPYTQALLSAIPLPKPGKMASVNRIHLQGEPPSPVSLPKGCRFCTRCIHASKQCHQEEPELMETVPGHFTACHLYKKK